MEDPQAESISQEFDSFVAAYVAKGLIMGEVDKPKAALVNVLANDMKEVWPFQGDDDFWESLVVVL